MSRHRFKIGDRVVIVKPYAPDSPELGAVGTVTSDLEEAESGVWPRGTAGHDLDLDTPVALDPDETIFYPPSHLEPYRSDGNAKGKWTRELRKLCKLDRVAP